MVALALLALQDLPDAAAGWGDVVAPIGGLAFAGLLIRIALGQADKRASAAEEREKVCSTTLAATTITTAALTEEVRKSGEEYARKLEDNGRRLEEHNRRMEDGTRRLAALESKVDQVLTEVRE